MSLLLELKVYLVGALHVLQLDPFVMAMSAARGVCRLGTWACMNVNTHARAACMLGMPQHAHIKAGIVRPMNGIGYMHTFATVTTHLTLFMYTSVAVDYCNNGYP